MSNKQALPYDYKRSIRIDDDILPEKWQEMDEEYLKKVVRHTKQMNAQLKRKLKLKTRMSWIATQYMVAANVMPGKSRKEIYELLKFLASNELALEEQSQNTDKTVDTSIKK